MSFVSICKQMKAKRKRMRDGKRSNCKTYALGNTCMISVKNTKVASYSNAIFTILGHNVKLLPGYCPL